MRVIAGKFRSRTLKSLSGVETRPTYDRLKETLFNVLAAAGMIEGRAWADLFAGTGAIGIEALSRGADSVHFAESSSQASRVLRQNLTDFGLDAATVAERTVAEALRQWAREGVQFDVCFLDPPYNMHGAYGETLRLIAQSELLRVGGVVVAEHERRFDPGEGEGFLRRYRLLRQGDSALSFYRRESSAEPGADDAGDE